MISGVKLAENSALQNWWKKRARDLPISKRKGTTIMKITVITVGKTEGEILKRCHCGIQQTTEQIR